MLDDMTILPLLLALAGAADPHSLGNPEVVRPTHLSLDLDLRFAEKSIRGRCDLTLAYPSGRSAARELDLDTRGLAIDAVTDARTGRTLAHRLDAAVPLLGQRLRITLPLPRPRVVRVSYHTAPDATALQWLEPRQTTSGAMPFLFTQSETIHARTWIPTVDSPGVRTTYDATVHVPPGMVAVMSAESVAANPARGLFRFRMPQAIPSYLIALAAGEVVFRPLSPRTGVYAEPAVVERAAREFVDVEKMMKAAEALYGPYRWGRWDTVVLPPSFPFGGMENPRLTFATPTIIAGDRSLVNVLAHELAHSWSGNLVTNATWNDFWLNEGFTRYFESRIVEALYGPEVADMQMLLGQRSLRAEVEQLSKEHPDDTRLHLDMAGRDPDDATNSIAYEKGANLLRMLEKRFGRERFDLFLNRYFAAHAFQSVTTATFVDFLKADLFKGDADAWRAAGVSDWIDGRGIPATMDVPRSAAFERTKAAAEAFTASGAMDAVHADWTTPEWLDFLANLPKDLSVAQMTALDDRFHLTQSGNSEILFGWLRHAIRSNYEPAYARLEEFLTHQGRMKFVRPLFGAMQENEKTRDLARRIYEKARPTYHPLAVQSVDAILK
jgi:leukotriene-A4 hydrolase